MDWMMGSIPGRSINIFFFANLYITNSGICPASYQMGTGCSFLRSKVQLGCDIDHSPPSNAELKNKQELYFICSPQTPSQCVPETVLIYFTVLGQLIQENYDGLHM
jgi:hypothetical protein